MSRSTPRARHWCQWPLSRGSEIEVDSPGSIVRSCVSREHEARALHGVTSRGVISRDVSPRRARCVAGLLTHAVPVPHLEASLEHEVRGDRVEVHVRRIGAAGLEEEHAHRRALVGSELVGEGEGERRAASRDRARTRPQAREIERARDRLHRHASEHIGHRVLPRRRRERALTHRAAVGEGVAQHRRDRGVHRVRLGVRTGGSLAGDEKRRARPGEERTGRGRAHPSTS